MAYYQSAKPLRRRQGSFGTTNRTGVTHQVFSGPMGATQIDSYHSVRHHMIGMGESMGRESIPEAINSVIHERQQQQSPNLASIETTEAHPELTNNSNQAGEMQFLLCKFFTILIDTEESLMKVKADFLTLRFDIENRYMKKFSPVMLFQRIDRATKGHITRQDVVRFLDENGFVEGEGFSQIDLKLIFRQQKTYFQQFVKLIIDEKLEHKGSAYFNERQEENDAVVRKIDTLPPRLEKAFCELLLRQINLKKERNFYREEIKGRQEYVLLDLFKAITFENEKDASKQIFISDIMRFFRFNKLLIEQERVEKILFERIIGSDRAFDYSRLHKLLTKETLTSIVHNPAIQVNGLKADTRRVVSHKKSLNARALSSLTGPAKLTPVQQCLRNRRCCPAPDCPHSMTKVTLTGPMQSCKLDGKTAHTKCFHTDHITDEELVIHLQTYLKDLLVLDHELEHTRIKLVTERDFYPKVCFKSLLATSESRDQYLANLEEGKTTDGLSELEATADSIYNFIKENAVNEIGMCSKAEFEAFIAEFNRQRLVNMIPCPHQRPGTLKYHDFLALISPKNRDFTELMLQRQTDIDLQHQENAYISTILHQTSRRPEEELSTSCRYARPIFIEEEMASNVQSLLAETFLQMILTHLRNLETVRTYEKNCKGKHETAHILRYVPQADNSSAMIRTADVLRFVKDPSVNPLIASKVRKGEPRHARGSSHHTCIKTVASTCEMTNTEIATPARMNHRREFDMIKSHEKEALFLSDRFGDRRETYRTVGGGAGLDHSLISAVHASSFAAADPGFAPEVLHLSKSRIDQSIKI